MTPAWHLKGKPYQVQLEALRRSAGKNKYAYFLEMGLGKSALTVNDYIDRHSDCDTIFVACPNSFKLDWTLVAPEWGINDFEYSVWPEPPRVGKTHTPHFNIVNFESVRAGAYDRIREIMDKRPCVLIVDESSAIKNHQSKTAKAVMDLAKRAKAVRLLNGTPLTQNVCDLFPQLKCVGELNGMNPWVFRHRFAVLGGYMGKQVIGFKNEAELHEIQERCSFRALKRDWADLPDKIYSTVNLEMTDNQRRHYKEMLDQFFTMVKDTEFDAPMVLVQMDKLRQIASGLLVDGDKHVMLDPVEKNPKVRAALELMNAPGKMIVVHFYRATGHFLETVFHNEGHDPAVIRGNMPSEWTLHNKKRFNEDPGCRVLISQWTAGSKGHTLIGGEGDDRCNRMFFFDGTFSLMDRAQMEDRIHRGAQDKACLYYDPILSPIDKAQLDALKSKRDVASAVVDAVRAMR